MTAGEHGFCTECGVPRVAGTAFCTECGHRHEASSGAPTAPVDRSPLFAPPASPPPASPPPASPAGLSSSPVTPTRPRRHRLVLAVVLLLVVAGVGGTAWWLIRDSGDDSREQTARPPATEATEASTTPAPVTPSATAPSDGASQATVLPTPSPTPTPTTAPTPTVTATRQPAPPLAIAAPFVNQPCNDEFVVMLATTGDPAEYESKLGQAVAGVPGAKYLAGADSCSAFLASDSSGLIYNAYVGPFPTVGDACRALGSLNNLKAWVRRLSDPSDTRELCMCNVSADALPVIGDPALDYGSTFVVRAIENVQWYLYVARINPDKEKIYGHYTADLDQQIRRFQTQQGLPAGGQVGELTWSAMQDDYCGNPDYYGVR